MRRPDRDRVRQYTFPGVCDPPNYRRAIFSPRDGGLQQISSTRAQSRYARR